MTKTLVSRVSSWSARNLEVPKPLGGFGVSKVILEFQKWFWSFLETPKNRRFLPLFGRFGSESGIVKTTGLVFTSRSFWCGILVNRCLRDDFISAFRFWFWSFLKTPKLDVFFCISANLARNPESFEVMNWSSLVAQFGTLSCVTGALVTILWTFSVSDFGVS